jgi:hypothetical protein
MNGEGFLFIGKPGNVKIRIKEALLMTVIEIIQLVISSGSLWFIVRCSFALGKISQRFDSIEKDIVEIKSKLNEVKVELLEIKE